MKKLTAFQSSACGCATKSTYRAFPPSVPDLRCNKVKHWASFFRAQVLISGRFLLDGAAEIRMVCRPQTESAELFPI
jgi:hypothetical protein